MKIQFWERIKDSSFGTCLEVIGVILGLCFLFALMRDTAGIDPECGQAPIKFLCWLFRV